MLSPTPYPDVNAVLLDFMQLIHSILGNQFLGLYLYGSLALGDFDPETSDIDLIVVTRGVISADAFSALREMHAHFDKSSSRWAGKIEAAYIPQDVLNHSGQTSPVFPQVEKGTELVRAPLEVGWVFQRYTLREHGVVVTGPDLDTLIDTVDPADMWQAANVIAMDWLDQSRQDPSWIAWVKQRANLSFIVLTLCRLLYSLKTGSVASKPAAARWVYENLDGRWHQLILRSIAGQQDQREISEIDLEEMLALLNYTVEQSQRAGFQ